MSEESKARDVGAVWRDQPEEKLSIVPERFVNRRTRDLSTSTRSEILASIGAALFFAAVIGWRFASVQARIPQLGFIAVMAWVLISLYWFRDRIWRKEPRDALAVTGLEYYRKELERRRDHLRSSWIWYGPLFLAFLTLIAISTGQASLLIQPWRNVAPLVVLLAVWTGFGLGRRRRHANELQREIDEIRRTERR